MIRIDTLSLNGSALTENATQALVKPLRFVIELPARMLKTAYVWQGRADQRHRLADYSDHQLHDIGLTRENARDEYTKPFWIR